MNVIEVEVWCFGISHLFKSLKIELAICFGVAIRNVLNKNSDF